MKNSLCWLCLILMPFCAYASLEGDTSYEFKVKKRKIPVGAQPYATIEAPSSLTPAYWHESLTPVTHYLRPFTINEEPSGVTHVDCIYLINLQRRPERLCRMQELFARYNLNVQHFNAVDGLHLSKQVKKTLFGSYPIRMTSGAIGCLLSHLSILQNALEHGFKRIWIMEDDVRFCEDPKVLSTFLEELEKIDADWDILYTDLYSKNIFGQMPLPVAPEFRPGQTPIPLSTYHQRVPVGSNFFRIVQRLGTWSMLLSHKGMQKILDYYRHVYLWSPYDVDLYYAEDLHVYTTSREIVTHIIENRTSDTLGGH